MRIGIVGAENSHATIIAKLINVDRELPGFSVTHIWGETSEFAEKAAREGEISSIVGDPQEMIGEVDAVVVDHRDGKHHAAVARPFIEAGLPAYVDKPFCTDLEEGVGLVRLARSKGVAITSFSTLPLEPSVGKFAEGLPGIGTLRSLVTAGPCDIDGPYSGVFFYGVHQVETVIRLIEARPVSVTATRSGADGVAAIVFDSGAIASLHCLNDWWGGGGFHAFAFGDEGTHSAQLTSEGKPLLAGAKLFCRMFATGVAPVQPKRYLTGVAVLEAMRESFETGGPVPVASVPEI